MRHLQPDELHKLAVWCGGMAAAIMLAVFISGGGIERLNFGRTLALFDNKEANSASLWWSWWTNYDGGWPAPHSPVWGEGNTAYAGYQPLWSYADAYATANSSNNAGTWVGLNGYSFGYQQTGDGYATLPTAINQGQSVTLEWACQDYQVQSYSGSWICNSWDAFDNCNGGYYSGGGSTTHYEYGNAVVAGVAKPNLGQMTVTPSSNTTYQIYCQSKGVGDAGWSVPIPNSPSMYITVNVNALAIPNPPASMSNSCNTSDTISLSWSASTGATGYYPRIKSTSYTGSNCPAGWSYSSPNTCYKDNISGTSVTAPGVAGATYSASWVHAGNSSGISAQRNAPSGFTCPAFDFSLAAPDKSVTQGSVATAAMGATKISGPATAVGSFSLTGLPSGVTASFSPSSCTPTVATCSTISFSAAGSATPGAYTVTAYATGGGVTRSDPFVLTVASAGAFTFTLGNTGPTSILQGASAPTTITAMRTNGLATAIGSFTTDGLPSDWTASFSPSSCTPDIASASCTTLTIGVPATASPGSYPITVYATGGGATQATQVTITVVADTTIPPTISISATDSAAGEDGAANEGTGTFTLTRTADPSQALVVPYTISSGASNATYGADYTLGGTCSAVGASSATIPAGQNMCTIIVTPVSDGVGESNPELITFTLQ